MVQDIISNGLYHQKEHYLWSWFWCRFKMLYLLRPTFLHLKHDILFPQPVQSLKIYKVNFDLILFLIYVKLLCSYSICSGFSYHQALDMCNHFETLLGQTKTKVAEISKQQKQLKEFFTININIATSWIKWSKRKQLESNRQTLHLNIMCKSTRFTSFKR